MPGNDQYTSTLEGQCAFGMSIKNRNYVDFQSFRYSFNGKEKDNEISGEGNNLDFGGRIYDSRIGRWLTIDPLSAKYPNYSPYNFAVNSPTGVIDTDGRDIYLLVTSTTTGSTGHAVLAVDNYKKIEADVYDKSGNITAHKGDWVPDGTVTIYDMGTDVEVGKMTAGKDVDAHIRSYKANKSDIIAGKLKSTDKQQIFNGVIAIKTSKETDDIERAKLDKIQSDFNTKKSKFNGIANNCSVLAADIVNDISGFESVTGKEIIYPEGASRSVTSVTPNKIFSETLFEVANDRKKGSSPLWSKLFFNDFANSYTADVLKDKNPEFTKFKVFFDNLTSKKGKK